MNELEMAQERGAALMDNTTLTGVEAALRYPREASIADEQSLADVLEALVLHESLVADSWGDTEVYPSDLLDLRDEADPSDQARPIFGTFDRVNAEPRAGATGSDDALMLFTTNVVAEALDRLERGLRSGELARQHELLSEQLGSGRNLSPLWEEPRDLRHEIFELYGGREPPPTIDDGESGLRRIRVLEDRIAEHLRGAREDRQLYAFFLLRAFYYEEIAAAFSLSYVPHTFRAQALLALERPRGGPSTGAFARYTTQLAAATRAELGKQVGFDVTLEVPPIAARIARDVESRGDLLPAALELRACEPARNFRRWVTDQERLLQQESQPQTVKKAKAELREIVANLGVEVLGKKREGGHPVTLKLVLGVPPIKGEAIAEEVVLRGPSWLKRALRRRRPYLTFFSQLTRDLVSGGIAPFGKRLRELPP